MASCSLIASILNPSALTDNFLSCLARLKERENFELVLVIDGDSNVDTGRAIEFYRSVLQPRVIINETSQGYGRANNSGADAASGDILVFLNTDVFPAEGAITKLVRAVADDQTVGVTQGLLLYPQNGKVQSCGHIFGPYINRHALAGRSADLPIVRQAANRQALTSAFYAVRRRDFVRHGGFDTTYLNSHEGMELALRLHLEGLHCRYYPDSQAYHIQGGSRRHLPMNENQQVALFWSRWHERLKRDLDDLLAAQLSPEQRRPRYLGINVSTNLFWNSTLEALDMSVEIIAEPVLRGHTLVLHDTLVADIQRTRGPLLFLTDNFAHVAANKLWFSERSERGDVILDCHGNAVTLAEILGLSP